MPKLRKDIRYDYRARVFLHNENKGGLNEVYLEGKPRIWYGSYSC